MGDVSLLTNHARLLLTIDREPGLRLREMAARLNLTERSIGHILRDLREAGYLSACREGRRVYYSLVPTAADQKIVGQSVGQLLQLLAEASAPSAQPRRI